jgi:NAD(P) transhydrogenase subunit beta
MDKVILDLAYLLGSILFVVGLKMLSHPETARKGNLWAAFGMGVAVAATLFLYESEEGFTSREPLKIVLILSAIVIGTIVGWLSAKKVKMTAMPEMVSLFNGMGGACAAIIGIVEFHHNAEQPLALATVLSGLIIGNISFAGSIIAWGKLNGKLAKLKALPYYNIINTIMLISVVCLAIFTASYSTEMPYLLWLLTLLSMVYGVFFVIPIGGADMPVVISLLNSFTGVAAAFAGFLYGNQVMLTGGILVGSAGTLLTLVMCKAMNRPLSGVIFGSFGGSTAAGEKNEQGKTIKEISLSDAAVLMNYSQKVAIIPGYGLAVAQAQHICHELEKMLSDRGVEVVYGIHPVAGRMPGHMNVLLAEADVSYDKLVEMEDINPSFPQTDVVIVLGANDVVNPAAHTDPSSPIFGMPILEVEKAKSVIVIKRGMAAGYAGIENELFYYPQTRMLFGDAKAVLSGLTSEVKQM